MKKYVKLFALVTVFALLFAACGAKEEAPAEPQQTAAAEAPAAAELGLTDWTLTSSVWSSANGASIDLTATPIAYTEGLTASFVVRLEGEDVVSNPCEWNGSAFTSFADLNAGDGYCYYVILSDNDGDQTTVEVNTPNTPYNPALINLAASLESFCHATITDSAFDDHKLTITQGTALIQAPMVGDEITCTDAELILNLDGGALAKVSLDLPAEKNTDGTYTVELADVSFSIPEMEDDHQLSLTLMATLSDGSTLTDADSISWFYSDGTVHMTVG